MLHTQPHCSPGRGRRVSTQFCNKGTLLPIISCAIGWVGGPKADTVHFKMNPKGKDAGEKKLVEEQSAEEDIPGTSGELRAGFYWLCRGPPLGLDADSEVSTLLEVF